MTIIEAIQNYTADDYIKSYADVLFQKGKLLILTIDYWNETKTYNTNDKVLFADETTSFLTNQYKSLINKNLNNTPIDNEKWQKQVIDLSHYIFKKQIEQVLSLIKISLNNKSIIYPCLLNKTILNEEDLKAYVSYIVNLYLSMMLYNQNKKINYKLSNSQSLDGASFSATAPQQLQELSYFSTINNPFALELLDFIMKNCYLDIEVVNNTQENYWLSDV